MASLWTCQLLARTAFKYTSSSHGGALLLAAGTALTATSAVNTRTTKCEQQDDLRRSKDYIKNQKVKLKTRMTSVGHFSLASQTAENPSVTSLFITMVGEKPGWASQDFKKLWNEKKIPERHPRFHYVISKDSPGYFENEHTSTIHEHEALFPALYRKDLQKHVEEMQVKPLDVHDSTWEVHVASQGPLGQSGAVSKEHLQNLIQKDKNLTTSNVNDLVESILFFRGHHALGDGVSLSTAVMDLCDESEEFQKMIKKEMKKRFGRRKGRSMLKRFLRQLKQFFLFWLGCFQAVVYQGKLYVVSLLETNPLRQLEQWASPTEDPQRTISFSMAAPVDEVKWVAQTLIGKKATVNDVFVSCVSAAVAKQLERHRKEWLVKDQVASEYYSSSGNNQQKKQKQNQHVLKQLHHMNVVMPVHLTQGVILPGQSMGNRIGAMVARVPGENIQLDSAQRLAEVHNTLYTLKRTPMPLLSYLVARVTSALSGTLLPLSMTQYMFSKANANAAAVVSNVRGAPMPVHVDGRLVTSVYGFVPLPPGIPIGVVVSSYAGTIKLALTAQPWAVPDGDQFMAYILEEYQSLLQQAKTKSKLEKARRKSKKKKDKRKKKDKKKREAKPETS